MTYEDFICEWNNSSPCVYAHTSGSTGKPKEVRLLKDDMRASAWATNSYFKLTPGSIFATPLSADYIAGKMMAVRAIMANGELMPLPISNRILLDKNVDLLAIVPSQVESLVENVNATKVRNLIIGGAPLSQNRACKLLEHGYNAFISYGMTETCSHIALAHIDKGMVKDGIARYHTMPGIRVSTDERGCLEISAPHLSVKKVITNDICEVLDEHNFIWKGRIDFAINSGGKKLFPEEMERLISPFMPTPFYIVGIPDEKWGEIAVVVMEYSGEDDFDEASLLSILRRSFDDHSIIPKRIFPVKRLPRTANGKIKRIRPEKKQ